MEKVFTQITIDKLPELAKAILEFAGNAKLLRLEGEMGAGKTTFIKAICHELKVKDTVSSPTFSIVNEYQTDSSNKIFHFDFYRIKSIDEVYDIGYEDYFYSGNLCLMEWAEKIEPLLEGEEVITIFITKDSEHERSVLVKKGN